MPRRSHGGRSSRARPIRRRFTPAARARARPVRPSGSRWPCCWAWLGGGWLYRDVLSAYLPSNAMTALQARVEVLEANGRTQADQIAVIDQSAGCRRQACGRPRTIGEGQCCSCSRSEVRARGTRRTPCGERTGASRNCAAISMRCGPRHRKGQAPAARSTILRWSHSASASTRWKRTWRASRRAAARPMLPRARRHCRRRCPISRPRWRRVLPYHDEYDAHRPHGAGSGRPRRSGANAAEGLPDAAGLAAELRAAIPALPQPAAAELRRTTAISDWA